ncbi:alginate lyase precursor [Nonlabens ulvanivorans]|nr:polysaccharide lyase family 7 protein [Nonlabens ulvanivorans]GAK94213.1 alginate lyase precursor [Nonlabens ulvanivorans]
MKLTMDYSFKKHLIYIILSLLIVAFVYACSAHKNTIQGTSTSYKLDPNFTPAENFDLSHWKITLSSGKEKTVEEINNGFTLKNQFYTDPKDGGMVFKNYPKGAGTTQNSTYSRVELREMLRGNNSRINTKGITGNNWVFSSSTIENQEKAGAIDGVLKATLKVNRVTETSSSNEQVGRIIIGQIHASDDEPIRLYYHKQPDHRKGAIYFAHEPRYSQELYINMIGNYVDEKGSAVGKYNGASSPSNGIALNEEFSYKIEAKGNSLKVDLYDDEGKNIASKEVDMTRSGFANDWLYFKAGVYSGNKTVLSSSDFEQVTFYNLEVEH